MTTTASNMELKSPDEIAAMRAAGRLVHAILDEIERAIAPGVSTAELDAIAAERITAAGAEALFRGVENDHARFPFPACICASVNEEIVHGIPDHRPLAEGDVVSIDCGVRLDGFCGDAARTFPVGTVDRRKARLLDVARAALDRAINEIVPGRPWREVAGMIQRYVERHGCGVVRGFVGHGIGREMHEEPKVPNFVEFGTQADFVLTPGLTIAIEPMVTAGAPAFRFRDDTYWSVVTKDRSPAAHFEHCVAVTSTGATVLTDGS